LRYCDGSPLRSRGWGWASGCRSYDKCVAVSAALHLRTPARVPVGDLVVAVDAETSIGIYNPTRSIIDAFRLRHLEGGDLAYTALRRWLRRPGSSPVALHEMARRFPRTLRAITGALTILQYE
jgi:hypothetical protein